MRLAEQKKIYEEIASVEQDNKLTQRDKESWGKTIDSLSQKNNEIASAFDRANEIIQQSTEKFNEHIKSLTDTPLTKFSEVASDLARAFGEGSITAEQYQDALGGARKSAVSSLMSDLNASKYSAPSAMSYGSRELVNAIADRSGGQNQQIKEAVKRLDNISRSINRIETKMPDLKAG
jgi:vacuolar-type H+-ATPase subunit I/STV1